MLTRRNLFKMAASAVAAAFVPRQAQSDSWPVDLWAKHVDTQMAKTYFPIFDSVEFEYNRAVFEITTVLMRNKSAPFALRRKAAEAVLDRGWGRADKAG